jgi:hypothetical protein
MTSEALHQTKQALLSSPDGVTTRDFARWVCTLRVTPCALPLLTLAFLQHIYARLSPNSAGHGQSQTSQDASARPDLNSIASLVLSYLPFAPQTPNAANAALRSSLLTAVTRVEQGSVLQDTCPPLLFVCDSANSTTSHSRSDQPAGPRPRLSPAADG